MRRITQTFILTRVLFALAILGTAAAGSPARTLSLRSTLLRSSSSW